MEFSGDYTNDHDGSDYVISTNNDLEMKTKAEIVQRLLSEGKIDAGEAVVLLMGEKQTEYIAYPWPAFPYPITPINPYPIWVVAPNSQPFYTITTVTA